MTRREGITLMEVLVAIMITGVGLLALMTLFPLGALEMAASVRDDRLGHIKHNAASIANMLGLRHDDPAVVGSVQNRMVDPNPAPMEGFPMRDTFPPDSPSYPVFVDPIGYTFPLVFGGPDQNWVGGLVNAAPRRVTYAGQGLPSALLYPWNVFLDEMFFPRDPDLFPNVAFGTPCPPPVPGNPPGLSVYERNLRYSWAYLVQMPQWRLPTQVDLTVVIYSGRLLDQPTLLESAFTGSVFIPSTSTVRVGWGATAPDVRVGSWILDVSMSGPAPRANFHRVVGITQTSNTSMDLEVTPPPRGSGPAAANYGGTVVVMQNIVEVYYRGAH